MRTITEEIIRLWKEAHNPLWIALKLGLQDLTGEPDTELVEMVIDNPANYKEIHEPTGA